MARPGKELVALSRRFVCVRVTDMRGVDLNHFSFDHDLTLAVVLTHPDGHVYHRFGGRTHQSPDRYLEPAALEAAMRATLVEHATQGPVPSLPRLTIEDYAPFVRRDRVAREACVHCHSVADARNLALMEAGEFTRDSLWVWPDPEVVGLVMEPKIQDRIESVAPESPAAKAGLRAGDRLRRLGSVEITTFHDVLAGLHFHTSGALDVGYVRNGAEARTSLELAEGFKAMTPLQFAWRPSKWNLTPAPGFGGRDLTNDERVAIGAPATGLAFEVTYFVNSGPRKATGKNARSAGLKKGDVVIAVGDEKLRSHEHFHAWFRLCATPKVPVPVTVLRDGKSVLLSLVPLP